MSLYQNALDLQEELSELRRALHREPEVGLDLPRTQEKVLAALDGLPLEVSTGKGLSSVTAVLRGGRGTVWPRERSEPMGAPAFAKRGQRAELATREDGAFSAPRKLSRHGPAVLLRGDMDALPVHEDTGLDYASRIPGAMHACGHDLHVAGLVGAARLLAARRAELPGDVVFMFQPGEEGLGGAKIMIDEGVLDAAGGRVVAAYALHVFSTMLPMGMVSTRPGTALAASDAVRVTVRGAGGHGSSPHAANDPVPALAAMVTAMQTMVTRNLDVFDPAVVTVGSVHAGTAGNVIPETASFEATVRSFSEEAHRKVRAGVERVVRGIAAAYGVEVDLDYREQYPVTVNDAAEADFALATASDLFGGSRTVQAPRPMAGSEDFSFVLQNVPGAFLGLGACPPDRDPATAPMNHSPQAAYDDGVLPDAAALLAELAVRRLALASAEETP